MFFLKTSLTEDKPLVNVLQDSTLDGNSVYSSLIVRVVIVQHFVSQPSGARSHLGLQSNEIWSPLWAYPEHPDDIVLRTDLVLMS